MVNQKCVLITTLLLCFKLNKNQNIVVIVTTEIKLLIDTVDDNIYNFITQKIL